MKNLYFIIYFTLVSGGIIAQPAFTSADMPNIGDNDTVLYLTYYAITNNLDTETGNGYAWDFSSLVFNPSFFETDSFRVKTNPVSTPYTNATIEEYRQGSAGQFVDLYSYNNDTLFLHRTGTVTSGTGFNPPLASVKFPVSFNQMSDLTSPIYVGATLAGERRTTFLYDGYGTLKMPGNKNYTDVFRIKKVETDTNYILNSSTTYTNYIWYKQGGQVPLLRLLYTGASNLYFVYGSKANNTSTSINELENKNQIILYPNPADQVLNINITPTTKIQTLTIYDIVGNVIASYLNEKAQINISDLARGSYFLQIKTTKHIITKPFIKN